MCWQVVCVPFYVINQPWNSSFIWNRVKVKLSDIEQRSSHMTRNEWKERLLNEIKWKVLGVREHHAEYGYRTEYASHKYCRIFTLNVYRDRSQTFQCGSTFQRAFVLALLFSTFNRRSLCTASHQSALHVQFKNVNCICIGFPEVERFVVGTELNQWVRKKCVVANISKVFDHCNHRPRGFCNYTFGEINKRKNPFTSTSIRKFIQLICWSVCLSILFWWCLRQLQLRYVVFLIWRSIVVCVQTNESHLTVDPVACCCHVCIHSRSILFASDAPCNDAILCISILARLTNWTY